MLNMERCLNLFLLSANILFVLASLIRGTSTSQSFSDDKAAFNCSVRLEALREAMRNTSATGAPGPLDVYVESSADLFGIGTTAACNARVNYLTGFSGRGGYAVVTSANATIWVNEQYLAQVRSGYIIVECYASERHALFMFMRISRSRKIFESATIL